MTIDRVSRLGHLLALSVIALVCLAVAGCGGAGEPEGRRTSRKVVEVKDLPETVIQTAKQSLPGVEFQDSWSNHGADGSLESYEVRGRDGNGKTREVRVSLDGKVLEME